MKLLSVNTGLTRDVMWEGKAIPTGIFKYPVSGRIMMRRLNIDGDHQGDHAVHGGLEKAVCVYPVEHYDFWRNEFPDMELPWGMFGENLTTDGMMESTIHLGDQFKIGSAEVMVVQPRMPCYKLGIKFGRQDIVDRVLSSGRTGFYVSVLKEGWIETGDPIELLHVDPNNVSVADAVMLNECNQVDRDLLRRAIEVSALPKRWRDRFLRKLNDSELSMR